MNNTSLDCSINNTTELRKLILENPDLPLLIFASEEAWSGEYPYQSVEAHGIRIEELTLYDDFWMSKDEYEDKLRDDLGCEEEYENLSDDEFDNMIAEKIKGTEFVKAIVVYVG